MRQEQISKLKQMTLNPVANAVFHKLAVRVRSRHSLMVTALRDAMELEGFNYTKDEYRSVIKGMSEAGIGELVVSRRGTILGLKNIRENLKEIGLKVCTGNVIKLEPKERLGKVIVAPVTTQVVNIGVKLKGKMVTLWINDQLEPNEIDELVKKLVR